MSQMFLKIMHGENSNANHRIIPVPEGIEVLFTAEPPTAQFINSDDTVIRTIKLTHSAYLINNDGKTISSFNNTGWKTVEGKSVDTSLEGWHERIKTLQSTVTGWVFEDAKERMGNTVYDPATSNLRGDIPARHLEGVDIGIRGEVWKEVYKLVHETGRPIFMKWLDHDLEYICCKVKKPNRKTTVEFFCVIQTTGTKPMTVEDNSCNEPTQKLFPVKVYIDTRVVNLPSWTVGDWIITNLTDQMSPKSTAVYSNGGAMDLGHSRGMVASTFIPDLKLGDRIPADVWEAITDNYHESVPIAISNPLTNNYYLRVKLASGEIKYGILTHMEYLLTKKTSVEDFESDEPLEGSVVKTQELNTSGIQSMADMFCRKPKSFEFLDWLIEDFTEEMDPTQTAVYLTGGLNNLGYSRGKVFSTFIEKQMMDVPEEVLAEILVKYGPHHSIKISHKEVKASYLRVAVDRPTFTTPKVLFGLILDPHNAEDVLKIKDQDLSHVKFHTLPHSWLSEDISKEWGSERLTIDYDTDYVRGSVDAKFIRTKELGLPRETLEAIDKLYPDSTPLFISGGGKRSSYLRFISSTADNNRWVQYARVITDNRDRNNSDTETHPLHPEN